MELVGDAVGVPVALMVIAAVVLITLPITFVLRPALAARPALSSALRSLHLTHDHRRQDIRGRVPEERLSGATAIQAIVCVDHGPHGTDAGRHWVHN